MDTYEKMFTTGRLDDGSDSGFGYGVRVESESGGAASSLRNVGGIGGHAGVLPGSEVRFRGAGQLGLHVGRGVRSRHRQHLPAVFRPAGSAPPQTRSRVSAGTLDRYVGDYRLAPGQFATFTRVGGSWFSGSAVRVPLTAVSDNQFLLGFAGLQITFRTNKDDSAISSPGRRR